jgi:serine/threonine protein kinase
MNEYRSDESSLKLKSYHPETASTNPDLGAGSEYASAENMAALPTNDRKSLLANRYQLQQILGQGGFGRTFLALDRHCFDRLCVVKEFLPQQQGDDEIRKSRELFVREAKILDRIDSLQVPKFFACFEEDRKLFLVQEYIQGQTYAHILSERQQQGQTFSELEVIKWLKDLLPVLGYLHDLQILHRDISLDNVMRHDDSHLPVLIDFGIGRSALIQGQNGSSAIDRPTQKSIVGKIGYAPYEQIWLGQSFPSSDLYALAVSAVVMLSGCDPQAFNRRLLLQEKWQLQHSVSLGLVGILDRMLQDNPSHRYQTAAANLADLEQLLPESQATVAPLNSAPTVVRSTPTSSTVPQNSPSTAMRPQIPTAIQGNAEFIAQCERESIEYLGPIGKFLVQNAIAENPQIVPADLIDLLARHIPQTRQVDEFRSKLRQFINK